MDVDKGFKIHTLFNLLTFLRTDVAFYVGYSEFQKIENKIIF